MRPPPSFHYCFEGSLSCLFPFQAVWSHMMGQRCGNKKNPTNPQDYLYLYDSPSLQLTPDPSPRPTFLSGKVNHHNGVTLGGLLRAQTEDELNKHGSCCHNHFVYKPGCLDSSSQEPRKDRPIIPQYFRCAMSPWH